MDRGTSHVFGKGKSGPARHGKERHGFDPLHRMRPYDFH